MGDTYQVLRSLANKGKRLSSRYFRTYQIYIYYFHINTSDPYDKTQGQVTYLSRSQMLINLGSYNLYRFSIYTIGLDRTDKTVCQIRR